MTNDTNIPRYIFGVGDGFLVVSMESEKELGLVSCRSIGVARRIVLENPGATILDVTETDFLRACKQRHNLGVTCLFDFEISRMQRIPLIQLLSPIASDGQHRHSGI